MIRAYRAFSVRQGRLAPCAMHQFPAYDGPVCRTTPPRSDLETEIVLADPVAAVRVMGEERAIAALHQPASQGFHAFKNLSEAKDYALTGFTRLDRVDIPLLKGPGWWCPVVATVDLFGKVVEHEYGYRAECMRITGIMLYDPTLDGMIPALESRYQCEVTPTWQTSDERSRFTTSSPPSSITIADPYGIKTTIASAYQDMIARSLRQATGPQWSPAMLFPAHPEQPAPLSFLDRIVLAWLVLVGKESP